MGESREVSSRRVKMEKIFQFMLILALAFFSSTGKALAQWRGYGQGMGQGMMGWGYGMGWFGMIFMALFWVAVIVGIIFLIRWLLVSTGAKGHGAVSEDFPLEILKRRYARGEINKEEFEQKRRDLGY
jgi:putative membrane protein